MSFRKRAFVFVFVLYGFANQSNAQETYMDCFANLKNDTLTIGNSTIERKWAWNNGDIIPISIENKSTGQLISFRNSSPSFYLPNKKFVKNTFFGIVPVAKNFYRPAHLRLVLQNLYGNMELKREFRIYPGLGAISCENSLKYERIAPLFGDNQEKSLGVEKSVGKPSGSSPYLDLVPLNSRHWTLKFVEFKDQTDHQNNLVFEQQVIPFSKEETYEGNVLTAEDQVSGSSFYVIKEAPNTTSQLNYPGYDFMASTTEVKIPFSGLPEKGDNQWIQGYPITLGVPQKGESLNVAIKKYLKNTINYESDRYDMVMLNTWGDRGQDGKISEEFILKELDGAKRLGITLFQIDDGWQQGLSANSSDKRGNLWDAWTAKDWEPNKERFPNGWEKILKSAKEKNIELGLWFHPTNDNEYDTWSQDADILIGIYKNYGIKYFKIDGVDIESKKAEINFKKFLDAVIAGTDGEAFFNLDLTANIRGGYFMFRYAGNLFLENRYTDWGKYYPYHTLRNLWMLSAYFPSQLLQIEFLNKWRNPDKYPHEDPFSPVHYDFDYLFAITCMAQPLAWLESSNLPEEAFRSAPFIAKYKQHMTAIHDGVIVPIGTMPTGNSWTGFQSENGKEGYFLVFRERNENPSAKFQVNLPPDAAVSFEDIYSNASTHSVKYVGQQLEVRLDDINTFVLVKYVVGN